MFREVFSRSSSYQLNENIFLDEITDWGSTKVDLCMSTGALFEA